MEITDELKSAMDVLEKENFDDLIRSEELGRDYSFKAAVDLIKKIYADLKEVTENAGSLRIPLKLEEQIAGIAKGVNEQIGKIRSFVLKGNESNAQEQHDAIDREVNSLYQRDLEVLPALIERASILKLKPNEVEEQISRALSSIREIENIKKKADEVATGIDDAVKEVRDALGKEGALVSAKDFEKQANTHKALADNWFWASIGAIVVTIIMVITLFSLDSLKLTGIGADYPRILQVTIFKVVLISIAYLSVYQCLKNYKVNQHLQILNRHRQLTLLVYPLMANATSNIEQSGTIVAQAAKAIFEPGTTGYLDAEENPNPINLTEIVNKIAERQQ